MVGSFYKETKADFIQVKETVILTPTPEATATPTPEATATPTPEPTATVPEVTVTPTSEETATPAPTETATVTPTPEVTATATPTPFVAKLTTLTVSPSTLKSGRRPKSAVVTAKDQNGDPMLGVKIRARAEGEKGSVSPKIARTGTDGTAEFKVSFESGTKDGRITFSAKGLTAVITQK